MELNARSPPLAQSFCTAGPVGTGPKENIGFPPVFPTEGEVRVISLDIN